MLTSSIFFFGKKEISQGHLQVSFIFEDLKQQKWDSKYAKQIVPIKPRNYVVFVAFCAVKKWPSSSKRFFWFVCFVASAQRNYVNMQSNCKKV